MTLMGRFSPVHHDSNAGVAEWARAVVRTEILRQVRAQVKIVEVEVEGMADPMDSILTVGEPFEDKGNRVARQERAVIVGVNFAPAQCALAAGPDQEAWECSRDASSMSRGKGAREGEVVKKGGHHQSQAP